MTKRSVSVRWVAAAAAAFLSASSAQAAYKVIFVTDGSNVVEKGSGTLDLTGFTFDNVIPNLPNLTPNSAIFQSGLTDTEDTSVNIDVYEDDLLGGITGPTSFGSGDTTIPTESSGDAVGIQQNGFFPQIYVPENYLFGSPLSETSTYADASLDSLGLTPGEYVYSWGTGAHADTFTISVDLSTSAPIPELSTWAMMLTGFAALGLMAVRVAGVERLKV